MAWSIGLHLGEHFAEIVAANYPQPNENGADKTKTNPTLIKKRYFTPPMSPEAGFSQFLTENSIDKIDRIHFATNWQHEIIDARHGSNLAILTTAGFEHWLELSRPTKSRHFTTSLEKPALLFDHEYVFGASERTNAEGHIEKLIEESDLEFLVAKLELSQIKNVAVCFMHSLKNSANEDRAQKFLEAKGYKVLTSSQVRRQSTLKGAWLENEKSRFWQTLFEVYTQPLIGEKMQKLIELATEKKIDKKTTADDNFIQTSNLAECIGEQFARTSPLLYCGLEKFVLIAGVGGNPGGLLKQYVAANDDISTYSRLRLQPLTSLGRNFFSPIAFKNEILSYEPGPIVFGRGMTATFLDLMTSQSEFKIPAAMAEKITERGRARLQEYMVAYARSSADKMNGPADDLFRALLQISGDIIRDDIRNKLAATTDTIELNLAGPLAQGLSLILKNQRFKPHIVDDEYFAAKALFMGQGQKYTLPVKAKPADSIGGSDAPH